MVIHSVYRQIEWKIFKSYEKARERLEAKVEFDTLEVELGGPTASQPAGP